MLTISLTAYIIMLIIMLIIPLLYIAYKTYNKHYAKRRTASRTQYREHIDHLVNELFPPATHAPIHTSDLQEATVQYQETKRKMIAEIRTYFNQRKINATLAKVQGSNDFVSVNQQDRQTFPTPPSIQMLLE